MHEALGVVLDVSTTVLRGHELDKQVLHRDLKPSNVMIRNFYNTEETNEVLVLDFDLSWYEGALGKSMISGALHNYIAPEQLITRKGAYSSRHTAVDVFGIGMLLYYATTKTAPSINVHIGRNFLEETINKIQCAWKPSFSGMPRYLGMAIEDATYEQQNRRCGLPTLIERIRSVSDGLISQQLRAPSGLANLEIAEVLFKDGWEGSVDINSLTSIKLKKDATRITLKFLEPERNSIYEARIEYATTADIPRGELKKYLAPRVDNAEAILKKSNVFHDTNVFKLNAGAATLTALVNKKIWTPKDINDISCAIREAANRLTFS